MTSYWDSSALVAALQSPTVRDALEAEQAVTRSHALAEIFSTMTGGRLGFRIEADSVCLMIRELLEVLEIVELTPEQVVDHMSRARVKGVRGGAIYDFLHAATAVEHDCGRVVTLNGSDFAGLFERLKVEEP